MNKSALVDISFEQNKTKLLTKNAYTFRHIQKLLPLSALSVLLLVHQILITASFIDLEKE